MALKMGGKKQALKGKAQESSPSAGEWNKSKCTESTLLQLVEGLLRPREVVQWRFHDSDSMSFENVDELILFQHFVERGLALRTTDFLQGLLSFYGIQIHHLNPNLILHLLIFVHFCEAFLGI